MSGRNGEKGKEKRDVGVEAIKSGTNQLQGKAQVFSQHMYTSPPFQPSDIGSFARGGAINRERRKEAGLEGGQYGIGL